MLNAGADETTARRETPKGHNAAKARIETCIREIEIICAEFGYDPTEWLTPDIEAMDGDDVPTRAPEKAPAPTVHVGGPLMDEAHDGRRADCPQCNTANWTTPLSENPIAVVPPFGEIEHTPQSQSATNIALYGCSLHGIRQCKHC